MKCFLSNALLISYIPIHFKDKSRLGITDYEIQGNTAINGVLYILHYIIARKRKQGHPIAFSPFNRCWPLYRMLTQENGDTATRLGLNFQTAQGTDVCWEAQNNK